MESYDVGVLAVLTALILTQSQIDFAVDIDRIERVVPKLAQATGLDLKFDTMVAEDVVLVRAKSVTASDLMKNIALAIDGEWVPTTTGMRLTRPDAKILECRRTDNIRHQVTTVKLYAEIEKRFQAAKAKPVRSPAQLVRDIRQLNSRRVKDGGRDELSLFDSVSTVLASSPIGLAAFEALVNIGPARIAKVPVGQARNFSPQQTALGIQSTLLSVTRLNQVEEFLRQCSAQAVKQNLTIGNEGAMMFGLDARGPVPPYLNASEKRPATDQISRAVVRVLRTSEQELEYQLLLIAPSGLIVAKHLEAISFEDQTNTNAFPVKDGDAGQSLVLDSVDRWVQKLDVNASRRMAGERVGPEALKYVSTLADPVENEPLRMYAKAVLLPVVADVPENLVVSLPEINPIRLLDLETQPTLVDAKTELNRHVTKESAGDWVIYRPLNRLAERTSNMRRAELRQIYQYFLSGGVPDHAMQADLAYKFYHKAFSTFINRPYQLMHSDTYVHYLNNSIELAFLGSLTGNEVVRAKGGIPVTQLSASSRSILERIIYDGGVIAESEIIPDIDQDWNNDELTEAKQLLSEAFPNGFTAANRVSLEERFHSQVGAFRDNTWQSDIQFGGSSNSELLRQLETGLGQTPAMPFSVRVFNFKLSASPNYSVPFGLSSVQPLLRIPIVVRDWPTSVRKQIRLDGFEN